MKNFARNVFRVQEELSRVTFGESSSLTLIGKMAFLKSRLCELHIPDAVAE